MVTGAPAGESAIGTVDYDDESFSLSSNQCVISAPQESMLERGVFVKIGNTDQPYFIGQIIEGPFYTSRYSETHGRYVAELISYIDRDSVRAVLSRPAPGTEVRTVESGQVQSLLGVSGSMYMGYVTTDRKVSVMMDSATLTRHVGVFGTTGSGKSNTIQVFMEEASKKDFAVLVFDVEGEYIFMDRPTDRLIERLETFGLKPAGARDFRVYVPYPSFTHRVGAERFAVKFCNVDIDVFSEVAGLSRLEQLYFQDLIEKVAAVTPETKPVTLKAIIDRLAQRLKGQAEYATMPPFIVEVNTTLYSKLRLISGLNIVDADAEGISMDEIFKEGRISVLDLSDASDYVRNIVIADLLSKVFKYKVENPESPKLLIVIEEAHTFISREKRDRMMATMMLIIETARRGRKRGLSLGIVTQQPAHLPSEILELCNTRIIHRISSTANIEVLKESTGNVPEGLWSTVPSLGRGEAIIATPKYSRALPVTMRPTMSMRVVME
ncbi:ATP-binding protein [Candidatus Bathyarchaeota archaeon]|nr:ATP-binding protein [Candidatus Bathyarchaeota archaeon]